jgi:S1-C subfamily serine protease
MATRQLAFVGVLTAIGYFLASVSLLGSETARKVNAPFPREGLSVLGTGSGVVLGPRLVLTNRHVATDDNGKPYDGFRVRIGPEYKKGPNARVLWICQSHDLAILETASNLDAGDLLVLNSIPALGTRVTAYGFPLGDEFGIGLTATGGQITRLPVNAPEGANDSDKEDIKNSLWHDAITSGGSSGGPLFSEHGTLVGLHFASLAAKHGLAIPGAEIADFLRKTATANRVKFIEPSALSSTKSAYEPKQVTVFVEILDSTRVRSRTPSTGGVAASLKKTIEAEIKTAISGLKEKEFASVMSGDIDAAFAPSSPVKMKTGHIIHIKENARLIQVVEEGILARIGGVLCRVTVPGLNSREVRAKYGSDPNLHLSFDQVYVVGEPTDYTTIAGDTNSYFPLIPVAYIVGSDRLKELVAMEGQRRLRERRAAATKRLRHTFRDVSGKSTVDAVIVKVNGAEQSVELVRNSDNKLIKVPLDRMSTADRHWINNNAKLIREDGPAIAKELLDTSTTIAANRGASVFGPTPAPITPAPATEIAKDVANPAGSDRTYLADLKETSVEVLEYGGKGEIAKGSFNDGDRKKTISLAGKESPKGIFAHPKPNGKSKVAYNLTGGKYKYFEATVGVDDARNTPGNPGRSYEFSPLTFEVWGDGNMLWRSQPFTPGSQPQTCRVMLPEVSLLELLIQCPGHANYAWAVWGDPSLVTEAAN